MEKHIKTLEKTLFNKEQIQSLLANIEQKKLSGTLSVSQYELLKADYQQKMASVVSEITAIKGEFRSSLQTLKERMTLLNSQLEQLRARHDAGEYSLGSYQKAERTLLRELNELKSEIPSLQALVDAKSSVQLTGLSTGRRTSLPRWVLITASAVAAVLILATGTALAYRYWLEPSDLLRIPALAFLSDNTTTRKPSDNTTLKAPASDNITTKTPGADNTTVQAQPSDNITSPSSPITDNATANENKWANISLAAERSIVIFQSDNSPVPGIVVKGNYVLTSRHNVRQKVPVVLETLTKGQFKASVFQSVNDVAILKMGSDNTSIPALAMGDSSLMQVGDEVAIIGLSAGIPVSSMKGVAKISKINETGNFHIDSEFKPGYAGGAVLNKGGEIVAILIGPDNDSSSKGMFAVPINKVTENLTIQPPHIDF